MVKVVKYILNDCVYFSGVESIFRQTLKSYDQIAITGCCARVTMLRSHAIFIAFLAIATVTLTFLTILITRESKSRNALPACNGYESQIPFILDRKVDENLLSNLDEHSRHVESDTTPLERSPKCKREVFLIMLVVSSPDGFVRRNAIRATWGQSYMRSNYKFTNNIKVSNSEVYLPEDVVKTVFLIGSSPNKEITDLVETEASVFGDIVIGGLHEHYRNLTMKTRLGLKWAYYHCKAKYILKTDDDVFVNPYPLVQWLRAQKREKFYSGWCNFNSPVVRDPNNKWYISEDDFAGSNYPGYCLGGGYVMSDDVLGRILAISYGRRLFPMEDLYVGLLIKELADVQPSDNKVSFNLIFDGAQGCRYNTLYLAHPVDPKDQLKMLLEAELAQRTCK